MCDLGQKRHFRDCAERSANEARAAYLARASTWVMAPGEQGIEAFDLRPPTFPVQWRNFLFSNPRLRNDRRGKNSPAYDMPSSRRESPEFLHAIGKKLDDHFAAMRAYAAPPPASPMPPPAPPPMHEPVPHAMHVDLEKTEGPDHEPDEGHMMPEHVAAPVSARALIF